MAFSEKMLEAGQDKKKEELVIQARFAFCLDLVPVGCTNFLEAFPE